VTLIQPKAASHEPSADCDAANTMSMSGALSIGIDLGTTYSAIAAFGDTGVRLIPNDQRELLTPSVVEVLPDGGTIVGSEAVRGARLDPDRVFALFKRQMGTDASYRAGGVRVTPVDLSAAVLAQLRRDATSAMGGDVENATVTVPAYFEDDARRATRAAAEKAGLHVRDLVHEPTAAAIAFGFGQAGGSGTALVYDLGGGTFDVTVVRWDGATMTVLATCGDHHLGGANWDAEIAAIVAEKFESRHGVDPRDDPHAAAELQDRAESAKRALSRLEQTGIAVICGDARDRIEVTRREFEQRTKPLLVRTGWLLSQALEDAKLKPAELDAVLLVGGSTRMPMCRVAAEQATGRAPSEGVDPDQAVVRGAAILAAVRRVARGSIGAAPRESALARLPEVTDVSPHALGFVVISADGSRYVNEVMIARNAPIPAEVHKIRRLESQPRGAGRLQVYVLQGDADRPLDSRPLGSWTFNDVPLAHGTHTDIEIAFRYDVDGVIEVTASVDRRALPPPHIDRDDRELDWTDCDPREVLAGSSLDVVLAIDCSGSMDGAAIAEARRACVEFADELSQHPNCRIAVVSFATNACVVAGLEPPTGTIADATARMSAAGSTDMAGGLSTASKLLEGLPGRRAVVLLTDGQPNDASSTLTAAKRLASDGVEVHARGVQGANEAFLSKLATVDGDLMTDLEGVSGAFRGIARQLSGAVQRA
jgi:molecular chaperone DnaK